MGTLILSDASKSYNRARRFKYSVARNAARKYRRNANRRNKKGAPIIKGKSLPAKNARQIRKLLANQDPKYVIRNVGNQLIFTNANWNTILELTDIPSETTPPIPATIDNAYNYREADATQIHLKNIRIHFTVHASPIEGVDVQPFYVALIKTTNGAGSGTGIQCPRPQEIFDPLTCQYNPDPQLQNFILPPWHGFRLTQGSNSETLENTVILKSWSGYLTPTSGHCAQHLAVSLNTSLPTPPGNAPTVGDLDTLNYPNLSENTNYSGSSFKPVRVYKHTHQCLNAKIKYETAQSTDAQNVKYFLVSLATGTDPTTGYRLNASVKVNFVSD